MKKQFLFIPLLIILWNCSNDDNNLFNTTYTGTVKGRTSCSGGLEPVYILYIENSNELDSIMTGTLNDEFQVEELKITFKIKTAQNILFCTQDKIYPKQYAVYQVNLQN